MQIIQKNKILISLALCLILILILIAIDNKKIDTSNSLGLKSLAVTEENIYKTNNKPWPEEYPFEMKLVKPVFKPSSKTTDAINKEIDSIYKQIQEEFAIPEVNQYERDMYGENPPLSYQAVVNFSQTTHKDRLVSVIIRRWEYTGGAHGNNSTMTRTFNTKDGSTVTLKKLFNDSSYLQRIAGYARTYLATQKADLLGDTEWMMRGTEPKEENYSNFAVNDDSISIFFDQYQVAPYSSGYFEIKIPLTDISDIVNQEMLFI